MTRDRDNLENCEIKFKEFGKPIFKAIGRKDKVKKEMGEFFKFKW